MKKRIAIMTALALVLAAPAISASAAEQAPASASGATAATPTTHFQGDKLAKDAKISMEEARAIALKAAPGKITDEELEVEGGGSGLRYSFDIKQGSATREVGVDAKTGKVLEDSKEGPNPD